MDLYYDPIADEHLPSPAGLIAPIWYMAPQRRDFAETAWIAAASMSGLFGDGDLLGLDDPRWSVMLAWHTGEFRGEDSPVTRVSAQDLNSRGSALCRLKGAPCHYCSDQYEMELL